MYASLLTWISSVSPFPLAKTGLHPSQQHALLRRFTAQRPFRDHERPRRDAFSMGEKTSGSNVSGHLPSRVSFNQADNTYDVFPYGERHGTVPKGTFPEPLTMLNASEHFNVPTDDLLAVLNLGSVGPGLVQYSPASQIGAFQCQRFVHYTPAPQRKKWTSNPSASYEGAEIIRNIKPIQSSDPDTTGTQEAALARDPNTSGSKKQPPQSNLPVRSRARRANYGTLAW